MPLLLFGITSEDMSKELVVVVTCAQCCSGGTLVLRYSRIGTQKLYSPAVAVLMTELCKLVVLFVVLGFQEIARPPPVTLAKLRDDSMRVINTCMPMLVPATLFTLQQQLNLMAATGLDAVTFQVTNQFKILPTALFSVFMLDKKLSLQQWLSLPLLSVGVAVVNNVTQGDKEHSDPNPESTSWWVGLLCALAAGVTSGYAGVHFERSLKSGKSQVSLWAMNVQLSLFGSALALINVLLVNHRFVRERGLLYGFGPSAWTVVLLQAVGGLIVAVTIRYADNILKGFATAVSIVVSWIISIPLFGLEPNLTFAAGISLVIVSLLMYSLPPVQPHQVQQVMDVAWRNVYSIATCALFLLGVGALLSSHSTAHTLGAHQSYAVATPTASSSSPSAVTSYHQAPLNKLQHASYMHEKQPMDGKAKHKLPDKHETEQESQSLDAASAEDKTARAAVAAASMTDGIGGERNASTFNAWRR